jgi:hypothetical protein
MVALLVAGGFCWASERLFRRASRDLMLLTAAASTLAVLGRVGPASPAALSKRTRCALTLLAGTASNLAALLRSEPASLPALLNAASCALMLLTGTASTLAALLRSEPLLTVASRLETSRT